MERQGHTVSCPGIRACRGPADTRGSAPRRVTLVASLLIGRDNATGGESTIVDMTGATLLVATLREPGTLLLGDDRRTLHGVSPIRPIDPTEAARRDVLVITFAPRSAR